MLSIRSSLSPRPLKKGIHTSNNDEYIKLKRKLTQTTAIYGTSLTMSYFIGQGMEAGISYGVGLGTSLAYLDTLYSKVDNIEKGTMEMPILFPICLAMGEGIWNHTPIPFEFDYGATLFGFLTYKIALLSILYDNIREMLLEQNNE